MDDATRRIVDATVIGEAIESLSIAVFVSDASLAYLAVNAAAAELVGLPRGELLGLTVADVVDQPRSALAAAAADVEREGLRVGESAIVRADGETVGVAFVTLAARLAQLPVLVTFVQPSDTSPAGDLFAALRSAVEP